jgi:hypothetical protein
MFTGSKNSYYSSIKKTRMRFLRPHGGAPASDILLDRRKNQRLNAVFFTQTNEQHIIV